MEADSHCHPHEPTLLLPPTLEARQGSLKGHAGRNLVFFSGHGGSMGVICNLLCKNSKVDHTCLKNLKFGSDAPQRPRVQDLTLD